MFDSHLGQNSCLFSLNLCEITCMILRARNGPIASLVNIDKQTRVKARGDRPITSIYSIGMTNWQWLTRYSSKKFNLCFLIWNELLRFFLK